ncbi:MAG TPA: UbiD family decarboxylase domain-containing protein, partial [Candidatus Binatia bacterium]|nr:UbiD family decarboxylase domain-containing protein [Candidatus Binatia bacterium]
MFSQDLREWVRGVEELGQLRRIPGIPWDLEIGGLMELILEKEKFPPALLFEKIPDKRDDMSILCTQLDSVERLALTMGVRPEIGVRDFIQLWRRRLKQLQPVEPEFVKDAPILENIVEKDINLDAFPIPRWHELDGGRYIG